ncbi:hypothetical protein M8C21_016590 [Ambrosia artemisiifolia]|uniref:CRIB domain-containing protein n=1 Tax=Ambrosia artemisiifolia TaxID=4212 RepID=A0AAD5GKL6_AMBAR|nr:hypothetical protein M8C21_016590 [Ambrosia artemisiifolia]
MSKAMKGLLKGLRYISEIFEADNDKEPEIQIGAPTDVKHVAHIGCDGPSSNAPSWMNEFQGSSDTGSSNANGGTKDSMGTSNRQGKSKQSKKQGSNKGSNSDNDGSRARRSKASNAGAESPSQESGGKKNRRKKKTSNKGPSGSNN